MQKYDDFGRPIYETAEEYNRAHRTGGSTVTYHQTATQRHATRESSKNAKPLVVGMVAFFFAMIFVVTFSIFNMAGGIYEEAYREPDYREEYGDEYYGAPDNPLPTGYENFIYNGVWFALPTTCKEMTTLGYELESYDLTDIVPPDFWDCISLLNEDGYTVAMVSISNKTGQDIPVEECTVEYFYISNPNAYDEGEELPDFVFGEGYTFESTYEDMESYLGVPWYHYEDHSDADFYYDSYEWTYYGEEETQRVMINFMNGKITEVSIEKDVYEE